MLAKTALFDDDSMYTVRDSIAPRSIPEYEQLAADLTRPLQKTELRVLLHIDELNKVSENDEFRKGVWQIFASLPQIHLVATSTNRPEEVYTNPTEFCRIPCPLPLLDLTKAAESIEELAFLKFQDTENDPTDVTLQWSCLRFRIGVMLSLKNNISKLQAIRLLQKEPNEGQRLDCLSQVGGMEAWLGRLKVVAPASPLDSIQNLSDKGETNAAQEYKEALRKCCDECTIEFHTSMSWKPDLAMAIDALWGWDDKAAEISQAMSKDLAVRKEGGLSPSLFSLLNAGAQEEDTRSRHIVFQKGQGLHREILERKLISSTDSTETGLSGQERLAAAYCWTLACRMNCE